jgi:hypothetical protein
MLDTSRSLQLVTVHGDVQGRRGGCLEGWDQILFGCGVPQMLKYRLGHVVAIHSIGSSQVVDLKSMVWWFWRQFDTSIAVFLVGVTAGIIIVVLPYLYHHHPSDDSTHVLYAHDGSVFIGKKGCFLLVSRGTKVEKGIVGRVDRRLGA